MIDTYVNNIKTVAVCFSGEPRMYNICAQSIKNFFNLPGVDVRYFAHTWNSNSYKVKDDNGVRFESEEYDVDFIRNDIVNFYDFEKLEVEQKFQNREAWDNLFYSDAKSNLFKREFEHKHNMIFDVVVKCRFDLAFYPGMNFKRHIKNACHHVHDKTIYSELFLMINEYYLPNIDDIFYYGSSFAMDTVQSSMPYIANNFYNEMYTDINMDENPYYNIAGPGLCMYRWVKQTNMLIHKIARPCIIYRKQAIPTDPVTQFDELRKKSSNIY